VLPHTSSVACNKQSFKPVQMFSMSSAFLLDSLACTFSTKRLCTSGSFRHHTFCLLTNSFLFLLIFAPRCTTLTKACAVECKPLLGLLSHLSALHDHILSPEYSQPLFVPPGFIRDLLCFVLVEHCVCNYQIHGTSKLQKQLTFHVTTAKPITTMYAMISICLFTHVSVHVATH